MGNTPSSPFNQCITAAVDGDSSRVAFPSKPLFQLLDVHPYNLDINVSPAAITYPTTADHIAAIIKCAGTGYKVQARGGGHSYANYALGAGNDNTIVVDLKNFQQFSMDTNTWTASIGAGHRLGDVTEKLLSAGNRAIAHGTCPDVGIGGHATMGGLGPASRMWGSAMDHVNSAEVVLANSSIIIASPTSYPEVFWAIKGAGSSFGIVTEFHVKTHPAPGKIIEYSYTFSGRPYTNLAKRFKTWQDLVSDPALSHKFASQVMISEVGMVISGTFFGIEQEFDVLNLTSVFPERSSTSLLVLDDWAGVVGNWAENIALTLGGMIASAFYSKNIAFTANDLISAASVDQFFQYLDKVDRGTLIWFAIFDLEGGAINDIAPDATSYGHRDTLFYFQSYAVNIGKVSTKTRSFVTGMDDILRGAFPGKTLGSYAGYVDPQLQNAQEAYFGANLPRLKQIKGVVDPNDIFQNPQTVRA